MLRQNEKQKDGISLCPKLRWPILCARQTRESGHQWFATVREALVARAIKFYGSWDGEIGLLWNNSLSLSLIRARHVNCHGMPPRWRPGLKQQKLLSVTIWLVIKVPIWQIISLTNRSHAAAAKYAGNELDRYLCWQKNFMFKLQLLKWQYPCALILLLTSTFLKQAIQSFN